QSTAQQLREKISKTHKPSRTPSKHTAAAAPPFCVALGFKGSASPPTPKGSPLARVLAAFASLPSPRCSPRLLLARRPPEVHRSNAMWALRRAGNPLRYRSSTAVLGFGVDICVVSSISDETVVLAAVSLTLFSSRVRAQQVLSARGVANLEVLINADAKSVEEHHGKDCQKPCCRHQSKPSAFQLSHSSGHFALSRTFSSQAGANSGDKEDELEEGFSDLEVPPEAGNKDASLTSEDSSDEDTVDEIGLPDAKPEKEHVKKYEQSPLLKLMLDAPRTEVAKVLENWAKDGNTFDRSELYFTVLNLRKRKWFVKALQLLEWVEKSKHIELGERDYASRLDLIAKVSGVHRAEQFIEKIPAAHRSEIVYRTLLANCVSGSNVRKSEQIFNKMKDLGFPVTIFACNQLLLLYKRVDKKKIADVLTLMEKENLKPTLFTYKLLVDTKGASNDIEGMEKVVESMQGEGIEPDLSFQSTIARHYIFNGQREKAEAILESMEGDDIKGNRSACKMLLPLYAFLGKKDNVERIWKVCEDKNARVDECISAIEAFGKLGDVEKAEQIFEDMFTNLKRLSPKFYNAMLKVYANQNLLEKGKELVRRMEDNNVRILTPTLDALVKLYVDAGEVERADSILHKLSQKYNIRPQYSSYVMLLDTYSKKGDVHNSEKVFNKLRQVGYTGRIRQYQLLLHAYLHANAPAYGFKERMKADNVFPNGALAALIAKTDPFVKKNSISELLD
ncbi:hypothetical protein EJB05_51267, partial [Eragrostis curvula]